MGEHERDTVVSFNGVTITSRELEILGGPNYINDTLIDFYFNNLSLTYDTRDILLVSPSVSFFLSNCYDYDSVQGCIEPLKLHQRKLVFFAVNDNDRADRAAGGNHWSLLVYYRPLNTFVHHDSLKGFNTSPAEQLYDAIKGFVGARGCGGSVPSDESKKMKKNKKKKKKKRRNFWDQEAEFSNWYTPQQRNYHDCGLYVLKIASVICRWYTNPEAKAVTTEECSFWLDDLEDKVVSSHVESTMRGDLLRLIDFFQ